MPVERLAHLLAINLRQTLVGCYVAGSISLGEFHEHRSDIDVIVVLQSPPTDNELDAIQQSHQTVAGEFPMYSRLEVQYVDERLLRTAKSHPSESHQADEYAPPIRYPRFADGRLTMQLTKGYLDRTARWILKHHGIVRYGCPVAKLSIAVEWNDVLDEMDYNLNRYHAEKAKQTELFEQEEWIEFLVLTLCRIVYTLENDAITTKLRAAYYARTRFGDRWRMLLDEAILIRLALESVSRYESVQARMEAARSFVTECIDFCNERYGYKWSNSKGSIAGTASLEYG